jgi:hypothetical protein
MSIGVYGADPSGNMGKLSSFIRLKFEKSQSCDEMLEKCYLTVKRFLSFCVGQENVDFSEIYLLQKVSKDDAEEKYQKISLCKIFDEYTDHYVADFKRIPIQLNDFDEYIVKAFEMFSAEVQSESKVSKFPWLMFLPRENKMRGYLTIDNIRDICTSIDLEFSNDKGKTFSGEPIKEKVEIKAYLYECLEEYSNEHNIDENIKKEVKHQMQISEWPLGSKMIAMYNFAINIAPDLKDHINESMISDFQKLRNNITHKKEYELREKYYHTYKALCNVLYICILHRMGLPEDNIKKMVANIKLMFQYD